MYRFEISSALVSFEIVIRRRVMYNTLTMILIDIDFDLYTHSVHTPWVYPGNRGTHNIVLTFLGRAHRKFGSVHTEAVIF